VSEIRYLSLAEVEEFAASRGMSRREAELALLAQGACPERYRRNVGTLGLEGQRRLLESQVAVVGCGGIGGYVVEMLARVGVGRLRLADGDVFCENNLNRQLLCREADLGLPKVRAAAIRAREVNRAVEVEEFFGYVDEANVMDFIAGCSVVVDALDNGSSRRVLSKACLEAGIPLVHGAIGGFYAQVGVSLGGPLGRFIAAMPDRGEEVCLGNPPFTPALAASLEVCEAVKLLTGVSEVLADQLLWADLKGHCFMRLNP